MADAAQPIRWLHLSDFHAGKDDYATRKMFDYILAHVGERKARGIVPDLLFITGDLANKGLKSEYETIWQELILPLQQEIGGAIDTHTFIVPGNHDVDRARHAAFSRDEIAKPTSHYLDPTDEGARLRGEMLVPRFRAYLDNDLTALGEMFDKPDGAYAKRLTIHGHDLGIVGINTAWISKDEHDERQLTPGKALLEAGLRAVQDTRLRIVLGHHPVDWLRPDQQKPIKSLLGQHRVLYLHGHLHDAWAEPTAGGAGSYLAIQAGAGFQAREGEPWRNGLVWGEADMPAAEVRLQPWRWIADQQAWTLATDAFHEAHRRGEWWCYLLPDHAPARVDYTPAKPVAQPPKGWSIFNAQSLATHLKPLDEAAALRYFDGAVPDWPTALSSSVRPRSVVGRLLKHFKPTDTPGKPVVTLLLGAGCEGKTTALLQAAYQIAAKDSSWRILQRRDESQPLLPDAIRPVLDEDHTWLLLLDEADAAAADLLDLLGSLPRELHGRVHVLLACRDTDWLASKANELEWSSRADFHVERLDGLDTIDANAIVQSWQAYGAAGLGKLAEQPEAERAAILEEQAKREARNRAGAFFGALLAVRSGSDLRKHARLLLERLGQRRIEGGQTLRDALAYIAVMHAENLEFLSRPVLAQALNCPIAKLHREALLPLGQEAAATTTSSFIFTRHLHIAQTLVSVLEEEFGEDIGARYVELSRAAIGYAKISLQPAPENLAKWRFEISNHFLSQNKRELAFNIAHAVLDEEPADSVTRTHLANLYRKSGQAEQAVRVFRQMDVQIEGNRAFYYEWGVAEGECGEQTNSTLLESYALADQCPAARVDNNRAKNILAGLGVAFGALHDGYRVPAFAAARMAVAVLGQTLRLDPKTAGYFQKHVIEATEQGAAKIDRDQAVTLLRAGIVEAERIGVDAKIAGLLPKAHEMTFDALDELTRHSENLKPR